jgi:hypothetical protein
LFTNFLPLAYNEYSTFVKYHKYKSKLLIKDNLKHYGEIGIYHAARKYNGKSAFYQYAMTYIRCSLYKGLTKHYPISTIRHAEIKIKKKDTRYTYDDLGTNRFLKSNLETFFLKITLLYGKR